jgi:hypothetical protein
MTTLESDILRILSQRRGRLMALRAKTIAGMVAVSEREARDTIAGLGHGGFSHAARGRRGSRMKAIWKYPIVPSDVVDLMIPSPAILLSVAECRGEPCVWAIVDPDAEWQKRTIRVYGTGRQHKEIEGRFIGTAVCTGGMLVWHVFEVPPEAEGKGASDGTES